MMKEQTKKNLFLFALFLLMVAFVWYSVDQMQNKVYPGEVGDFKDIPHIGDKIAPVKNARQIKYYYVRTYRDNYFYITGLASPKDIDNWFEQYPDRCSLKDCTEPQYVDEKTVREYDPGFLNLPPPYWWADVHPDDSRIYWINMNYNPQTEKFYIFVVQNGHRDQYPDFS